MIEEKTIIKELKAFVKQFDTNIQAAAALKVTAAQLSTTLNGKANVIPEKILKKLGYKSKLVYLPLKEPKPIKRGAEAGTSEPKATPSAYEEHMARQGKRVPVSPVVVSEVPVVREATDFINVREG